jgi:hypothetical protein
MESLEDIEKALSRLVPSAISEKGQQSLEDLIDGLAAEAGEEPEVVALPETVTAAPKRRMWNWTGGIAAAAAAVVAALVLPHGNPGGAPRTVAYHGNPQVSPVSNPAPEDGVVLLGQTERVEAAEPEDWVSEADGVTHRAWRFRVVNEERVQDVQTGYEVTVSHPREKVVLMPVTAF